MATQAAMRTMLTRIGFTIAAAQVIVDEQGIDSLSEVKLLTDDEIENLCKVIRRPGGSIPGANPGAPQVPNLGTPVNLRAENQLKLLAFYLRHQERVNRDVNIANITLEGIRTLRELREFESNYRSSDHVPTINTKDWPKTMENILEYLRSYLGDHKIPLAYIVRKDESPPVNDPDGGYATVQDEMIARAKHFTLGPNGDKIADPVYITNREKVWEIIAKITRDQTCWTYVKPAQRTRDGRMAFEGLYQHFLGPNNVDNMATMAEDKLKTTVYNGEQRRWDFERYINVHKSQHSVMEGLVEHGYTGIDPRSKVRYLLDGIKTDKFDSVKTRIMSDATLRNDFDGCVTLYQDFIKQTTKSKSTPTVGISELKTSAGSKRKFDTAVEDRYYTKSEYDALTAPQKKDLAAKRLKRGHKPGAKDSKVSKTYKSKGETADVIKNLKAVKRTVAQLSKQMTKPESDSDSLFSKSSTDTPKKTNGKMGTPNRSNAALTRQPTKKASK